MTTPGSDNRSPMAPARRWRDNRQTQPADYQPEEVAQGQETALLGALGRMGLRLEVLGRQQAALQDEVLQALHRLETRIYGLEVALHNSTVDAGTAPPAAPAGGTDGEAPGRAADAGSEERSASDGSSWQRSTTESAGDPDAGRTS